MFENDKKKQYTEKLMIEESKVELARVIIGFQPKRGYKLVTFSGYVTQILF